MTPVTCMAGRKLALFGLGGSGLATLAALKAGGADVLAYDDGETARAAAQALGHTVSDLRDADWTEFDALVLAPGVPLTHPAPHWTVERARAAGLEILGDIELFCRERAATAPDAPFVAITGTNGKSTTTALVAHLLREAGRDVQMGGNIGTAILSLAPPAADRVHVIEMSSFQIDLTPSFADASPVPRPPEEVGAAARPDERASGAPRRDGEGGRGASVVPGPTVGLLLNVTPDHLDRHGTMEAYAAIKERLVMAARIAVVGVDDATSEAVARRAALAKGDACRAISAARVVGEGVYADGTRLVAAARGQAIPVADIAGIGSLRGTHNAQNAAAAVAIGLALGLDAPAIASGLASFPGLAHRMEQVGRVGRVLFVNDSKATNADSAEKALGSFEGVHWILGGKAKEGGIAPLRPFFGRVARAYLIGAATEEFAATLDGAVPLVRCGTLDRAVAEAAAAAARDGADRPVVLLSPACASFDQFPNFEVRGDRFRDLVRALPGFAPLA